MNMKLISVDFSADFGFLKKEDINEGIYLTYNCLHKPALLGILGAIAGLGGLFQGYIDNKLPEYYEVLGHLKTGVRPMAKNGMHGKTIIKYNNSVGYANLDGGNLIVAEQTLIKPSFQVFILVDLDVLIEKKLYSSLMNHESYFIPYLGKNEFQLWWTNFQDYDFKYLEDISEAVRIDTLFIKKNNTSVQTPQSGFAGTLLNFDSPVSNDFFMFFEELPVGYDENLKNYRKEKFIYTNKKIAPNNLPDNVYWLKNADSYVQLI